MAQKTLQEMLAAQNAAKGTGMGMQFNKAPASSVAPVQPAYNPISSAQQQYQAATDKANAANEARYSQGLGKMTQAEAEANKIGTGQLAALEQTKQKDVAAGMQSLVGAGMGNTTVAASLPGAWESNVGTVGRLQIGEAAANAKMNALGNTAGFIERRNDVAPDMGQYGNLVQNASMGSPTSPQAQSYQPSAQPQAVRAATDMPVNNVAKKVAAPVPTIASRTASAAQQNYGENQNLLGNVAANTAALRAQYAPAVKKKQTPYFTTFA